MDTDTRDKGYAFTVMAERMSVNQTAVSSAYVICPPDADPISSLVLDTQRDALAFWTNIKSLAELQISDLIQQEKQRTVGWGGLR